MYRRYMEEIYELLAWRIFERVKNLQQGERYLVGVAGIPGSGKSSLARAVCARLNHLHESLQVEHTGTPEIAVVIPMDGFHYYKSELRKMENPDALFARRGAHWTFNAAAFLQCLKAIKDQPSVKAPSFDHGVGDPMPDSITVAPYHYAIFVEGNYLLHDEAPWSDIGALMDETWFVDCNTEKAMDRLFLRQTGNGLDPVTSAGRIETNDKLNAQLILETRKYADIIVPSVPFREMEELSI